MTSQLSRVQIVDVPQALPGHCAICGTTQGPLVDFGMDLDFYGVVYFCVDSCMVQIANAFDYHSPRQWKMIMKQVEEQRAEINGLRDQNEQLRNAVDSLSVFAGITNIDRTSELDVDAILQGADDNPEQLGFDFDESSGSDSEGEDGPPEQNDESRSSNVQRDDSIDDLFNF